MAGTRGKAIGIDLEEPLWPGNVLQIVLAEIAQRDLGWFVVLDDPGAGVREHDLAAVRCSADASSAADPNADVALPIDMRLSGVQSHSYANRARGRERALRGDRGCDGVGCALKGDEEGIAFSIDSWPRWASKTSRRRRRCSARRSPNAGPWLRDSSVEPSISLKRKVTVPLGSPAMRAMVRRLRPKFITQRS